MRAAAALIAVAVAGCDALLHLDDLHPPAPVASYRKAIAITSDTALEDVPVSIALDADPDLDAHAQSDGGDLVFSDGTNELASEIVAYSAGTLDAWVRVPALAQGSTTVYLGYGGAARTGAAASAWPASFVGVWHQSDLGATAHDSTSHGHDLIAQAAPPASEAGIAGRARMYDPSGQQMCVTDADQSLEFDQTMSFAFSQWVYVDQAPVGILISLHKGGSATGDPGFDVELGMTTWDMDIADATTNQAYVAPAATPQLGRWVQMLAVVDRGQGMMFGYLDGSRTTSGMLPAMLGSLAGGEPFCLGGEPGGGAYAFVGGIDEARVVTGVPSDAQIRFEHANLATRDQVIDVGAEEVIR